MYFQGGGGGVLEHCSACQSAIPWPTAVIHYGPLQLSFLEGQAAMRLVKYTHHSV